LMNGRCEFFAIWWSSITKYIQSLFS
jgi:hypothetical protein